MNLQYRIELLGRLGKYMKSEDPRWLAVRERAERENAWFTSEFLQIAIESIADQYLEPALLKAWAQHYQLPDERLNPQAVGIVMAGNIPLVGFHDWLCCFVAGHKAILKTSSKDALLLPHLLGVLTEWEPAVAETYTISEFLKGCNAYIATGSNNSAGYFEYYFSRFPHIIRKNRTSVAVLQGSETTADLHALAKDVHLYFGLGCRNVTHLIVPTQYDFVPLLEAFRDFAALSDHHKYKNNYDYNLALHILNKKYYMTNGSILLLEDDSLFAPVSQVYYRFADDPAALIPELNANEQVQAIIGNGALPFGSSQFPALSNYADAVDTMQFLSDL